MYTKKSHYFEEREHVKKRVYVFIVHSPQYFGFEKRRGKISEKLFCHIPLIVISLDDCERCSSNVPLTGANIFMVIAPVNEIKCFAFRGCTHHKFLTITV